MKKITKTNNVIEYGDFQTPHWLAKQVCNLLTTLGCDPKLIVEPTCGIGAFLLASLREFPNVEYAFGMDINESYVDAAKEALQSANFGDCSTVEKADLFQVNWSEYVTTNGSTLIIGNPPWVTNTKLSTIGSKNLPMKRNLNRLSGIEAITGSSNFDISEWLILELLKLNQTSDITIAMLCKTTVARKILKSMWSNCKQQRQAKIFRIDSNKAFNVNVDACLLYITFDNEQLYDHNECDIYSSLAIDSYESTFGYRNGTLIAEISKYDRWQHLRAARPNDRYRWRSGIKHDCAKVMELQDFSGLFLNRAGESVDLEDKYVFPMLKSSDVAKWPNGNQITRWMLVTQKMVGQETYSIKHLAPKTWMYLIDHANQLDSRKSSIYKGKPRFSVFGVGDYSFSQWKIAISGLYKNLNFALVGPYKNKPVVFDDTCYVLACQTEEEARLLFNLLKSQPAQDFFKAHIFWDAKRPITTKLLNRLDLSKLAHEMGVLQEFDHHHNLEFGSINSHPTQLRLLQ